MSINEDENNITFFLDDKSESLDNFECETHIHNILQEIDA